MNKTVITHANCTTLPTISNHMLMDIYTGAQSNDPKVYQLVESFYGPGAVGCWLVTTFSLFLSWTFNPRHIGQDHITNEFIAVLIYPGVACGHLAFLLSNHPASLSKIFTSPDLEMRQRSAAIFAPVIICKIAALNLALLLLIPRPRWRAKQYMLILILTYIILWINTKFQYAMQDAKIAMHGKDPPVAINVSHVFLMMLLTSAFIITWRPGDSTKEIMHPLWYLFLPYFLGTCFWTFYPRLVTAESIIVECRPPFSIPKTNIGIKSFDQMFMLCGGGINLLFSSFEIFWERRKPLVVDSKLKEILEQYICTQGGREEQGRTGRRTSV